MTPPFTNRIHYLRIISEPAEDVFCIGANYQTALAGNDLLDCSLAGLALRAEFDGNYVRRFMAWLWRYRSTRHVITERRFKVTGKVPAITRMSTDHHGGVGCEYCVAGYEGDIWLHEKDLEMKLSGRLYIREWTQEPAGAFVRHEIKRMFRKA